MTNLKSGMQSLLSLYENVFKDNNNILDSVRSKGANGFNLMFISFRYYLRLTTKNAKS